MTSLIVDASIAAKWFVDEEDSEAARQLSSVGLIAPELVLAEVANVLWKKTLKGSMRRSDASLVMHRLPNYFQELFPLAQLGPRAIEIANVVRHPVYDCFYFALAEKMRLPLVSADAKLIAGAARLGTIDARALW